MAHIRCDFRSEELDMNTSMTVVLPEDIDLKRARTVYLFHGLADNCTGWSRYTSVERYARTYQVALVIPEVQRSFYTDMAYGSNYFKYIHQGLARICHRFFGLSQSPHLTYLMGLSMGGYGALKSIFLSPEKYGGCAVFSPVTDIKAGMNDPNKQILRKKEYQALFGTDWQVPDQADLFCLANKMKSLPKLYMACGEQDPLLADNQKMADLLASKNIDIYFEHWPGKHDWEFWDGAVKKAFDFMFQT